MTIQIHALTRPPQSAQGNVKTTPNALSAEPRIAALRQLMHHCRTALIAAIAFIVGATASNVFALDIDQIVWGFDGQVVPNRFNILSVLVNNSSPQVFDGFVRLRKIIGTGSVDAPIVEQIYLAPHTTRWVQLYPYVKTDWEDWEFSWGPTAAGQTTLTKPRHGKPAAVLLDEPGGFPQAGGAIKRLPDNLFPPFPTATDALRTLVLDHAPRWEEPRQRSFLEWLKRGGRVHVLQMASGEYPEFAGLLKSLNQPFDKQQHGAGVVFRHPRSRRQLDGPFVEKFVVGTSDPTALANEGDAAGAVKVPAPGTAGDLIDPDKYFNYKWEGDDIFLTALKKMSRPSHTWVLIHLMSLVYIGLVFPGCYMLGQRYGGDYRITFGALLGIVGLFSLLFLIVGRRGYGETTAIHSVAIAHQVEEGLADITAWSNAFVVDGGDYTFTHDGSGRIYSTCQTEEPVRGEIRNGADAKFIADMPPFSSRAFGHRATASLPRVEFTVLNWETGFDARQQTITLKDLTKVSSPPRPERVLRRLILKKPANFPENAEKVIGVFGRYAYNLSDTGPTLEFLSEAGALASLLQLDQFSQFGSLMDPWATRPETQEKMFSAMMRPLMAHNLDITDQKELDSYSFPEGRLRLYVYAPLPSALLARNEHFATQHGWCLYCFDLVEPTRQ